jgi:hypothetical protein
LRRRKLVAVMAINVDAVERETVERLRELGA